MSEKEPYNLKRWRLQTAAGPRDFYTCGRPGRSVGRTAHVPNEAVRRWAIALSPRIDTIISLLGTKKDGSSEFKFYDMGGAPGMEAWLNHYFPTHVKVIERPTVDARPIAQEVLAQIEAELPALLAAGRRIVIVDSAGWVRSGSVCACVGATAVSKLGSL